MSDVIDLLARNKSEVTSHPPHDGGEIIGYRKLSKAEIDLMNSIKEMGADLGEVIDMLASQPFADQRSLANARTELQTGFMWLLRSIAKPTSFA